MSVVLITGCSSGMGEAAALAFARAGDTVVASMRDTGKAAALRAAAKAAALEIRMVALDVTRPETFAGTVESIVADYGGLDVLVNNAGVLRAGALEDLGERGLREVMETNFFGALLLSQAVLPQMRRQRSGCIIMMSSLSGIAGLPGDVAYTASKFAIEGATEALRHEVDRWNIRLALVEPALYATRIFDASLPVDKVLPDSYPADSPYRGLIEHRLRELRTRLPQAFDPRDVGELLVTISRSDGRQLRWPADAVASKVLATMFAQDEATRDAFLRGVSGTDWWSEGGSPPP
jgi:NAD(P)-dependent dehydrogenase (short-subunit alcohol dehydrogenase family)